MTTPKVYKYMTPSPHSIGREQTLAAARAIMRKNHIRHLPVLDGGVLVGLVSDRDLRFIESLRDVELAVVTVEEAMTPDPYFVSVDTPVKHVAAVMIDHKYGSAIVVDHGHVVGIFTTIDALCALLDLEKKAAELSPRPARQ
jgi:acetoin utilization protein AcuB